MPLLGDVTFGIEPIVLGPFFFRQATNLRVILAAPLVIHCRVHPVFASPEDADRHHVCASPRLLRGTRRGR